MTTGPGLPKATAAIVAGALLIWMAAGCGGAEGVSSGATVTAYVVPPLCAEAERELEREKGRAGDLRVKAVCLPSIESHGHLQLAIVGSNARRSTEDSTAVAYLEAPGKASRFTHPILETAEIPWIESSSGKTAMARLLRAIDHAGSSGSLRSSLNDELN